MSVTARNSLSPVLTWGGLFPTGLAFFLLSFIATPAGHRKIRAVLGGLAAADERNAGGSFVATFMGDISAAQALEQGRRHFRGLPYEVLAQSDLESNADTGLHDKTIPMELGTCDALCAHQLVSTEPSSWTDLNR